MYYPITIECGLLFRKDVQKDAGTGAYIVLEHRQNEKKHRMLSGVLRSNTFSYDPQRMKSLFQFSKYRLLQNKIKVKTINVIPYLAERIQRNG